MEQEFSTGTDTGRVRPHNEDTVGVKRLPTADRPGLYIVADGMGGHKSGDVASKLAVNTVLREFDNHASQDYHGWLRRTLETANQVVYQYNVTLESNMGTTLVAALVIGLEIHLAHVGDSRAYLISGDQIWQITNDHSVVKELLRAGAITPEVAEHHPSKHMLTQAIGLDETVHVESSLISAQPGDYLVLCSDGLSNEVTDEQLLTIVNGAHSADEACEQLMNAADQAGAHDNVTVIVVQLKEKEG